MKVGDGFLKYGFVDDETYVSNKENWRCMMEDVKNKTAAE